MSYRRVIPRDLFNEANFLKCLGKLCIEAERTNHIKVMYTHEAEKVQPGWGIYQDQSSGALAALFISVTVRDKPVRITRPLNARGEWPLYAEAYWLDTAVSVFTNSGELTKEFITMADEENTE